MQQLQGVEVIKYLYLTPCKFMNGSVDEEVGVSKAHYGSWRLLVQLGSALQ